MTDESNRLTDDANDPGTSGRSPDPSSGIDDEAALERLRALTAGAAAWRPEPERGAPGREVVGAWGRSAPRRRLAAAQPSGRMVARIIAPAVFLAAVIIVVALLFQSGVIGGGSEPSVSPSPKPSVTATTTGGSTKPYVVKSGDTLSGIAEKFDTTITVIEDLNPNLSSSSLVVGAKIKVPRN